MGPFGPPFGSITGCGAHFYIFKQTVTKNVSKIKKFILQRRYAGSLLSLVLFTENLQDFTVFVHFSDADRVISVTLGL